MKIANPQLRVAIPVCGWLFCVPVACKTVIDENRAHFDSGKFSVIVADTLKVGLEALRDGYVNVPNGQRPAELEAIAMNSLAR